MTFPPLVPPPKCQEIKTKLIGEISGLDQTQTREHFYHVGSTEDLRHPMIEALITNFPAYAAQETGVATGQMAFFERAPSELLASRQSAAR